MPGPFSRAPSRTHAATAFAVLLSGCCSPCSRSPRAGSVRAVAPLSASAPSAVAVHPSADGTRRLLVEAVRRVPPGTTEIHSPNTGIWGQIYGRVDPWGDHMVLDRARFDGEPDGTTLTDGTRFSLWRRSDGHFVADGIPIPHEAVAFEHRILEIEVGVVGRWRAEYVRLPGPGSQVAVRCGPFILSAKTETERITVSAAASGEEGERDWRAWRARVPLRAFGHRWISEGGLVAMDRNGSQIGSSRSDESGDSTRETFLPEFQDRHGDSGAAPPGFAWPVTLEVRIPEDVRMTTLRTDLAGIALPP